MGSRAAISTTKWIVTGLCVAAMLLLTGCGLIEWFVDAIEKIAGKKTVEVRISGERYLTFDKKDDADQYIAKDGYLCVVHDPGCGIKGNDGADTFFTIDKDELPLLVKLERVEFTPYWPQVGQGSGGSAGIGSFGMTQSGQARSADDPLRVDWHNACFGDYKGKNLYYAISFVVSMPEGYDLGEPTADISKTSPCTPPEITKFEADPSDYIPIGETTTLRWEIAGCAAGCEVSLEAHHGLGYSDLAFKKTGLQASDDLEVKPSQTHTRFTLRAQNTTWSDSRVVEVVWQRAEEKCAECGVYFFKVTSGSFCATVAMYGQDEASAKATTESKHGGSAEPISEQEYYDGCEA